MIIIATLFLLVGDWPGTSVGVGDGWPDSSDPMTAWAWPERGYLVESDEDRRLHNAGIAAFRASWASARSQFSERIISIIAGGLFAMPESYRRLFAAREYHCPTCWDFQPLEIGSAEGLHQVAEMSIRAAGADPETYSTLLVLTDFDDGHTWDDFRPLRPLSELVREGYFHTGDWYAAQLEGEGLYDIPIWKVSVAYPEPDYMRRQDVPGWVLERLNTVQGEPYLDYAMGSIGNLTPAEYLQKHKYFPMDRTPRDLQYGRLRYEGPTIPHYVDVEDPTVPYYNQYWAERLRWLEELNQYNEQLDAVLGTKTKRARIIDRLIEEQDIAEQMFATPHGDGQTTGKAILVGEPVIEPNQYCPIPLFKLPLGDGKYFTWESMGPGMKQITEYDPRRYDD